MERITFQQIVDSKKLSDADRATDLQTLKQFHADSNERKFCGNPFLYHYQMENLCKTRVKKLSLYEKMNNDQEYEKLYKTAEKLKRTGTLANRLFEAERFNGCVAMFKASTAKYLYKHFKATKVLDPTAGWGGRMLGAWALDISYTGIDANRNLQPAYNGMMAELNSTKLKMLWDSWESIDFSTIDYDFVLTSPPYYNLEIYEGMPLFESKKYFYVSWLIPLINKCLKHINPGGRVCFNMSPTMYDELKSYGFRECDESIDLLQQKRLGKDKEDKVYIWLNASPANDDAVACADCDAVEREDYINDKLNTIIYELQQIKNMINK
jgi:hypothetical protein